MRTRGCGGVGDARVFPRPAGMRALRATLGWMVLGVALSIAMQGPAPRAQDAGKPVQLFVPDGQLKSHLFRVFVTREITGAMDPRLRLIGSHVISEEHPGKKKSYGPAVVAPQQKWVQEVEGERIEHTGTLLLFDLCHFPIPPYQPMQRVTPTLTWMERDTERSAIGGTEVNLANSPGVFGWTLVLLIGIGGFIVFLGRRVKGKAIYILCSPDGGLSLWRSQIAAWTVAIGGMVVAYGLIRLEIPDIPESLVALMGLSLATGGISYVKVKDVEDEVRRKCATEPRGWPRWSSLITDQEGKDGNQELSIAKAQMVFWTGLMLALFVTKSALDGVLWDVPWEMVALMGMSQAGYVSPKLVRDRPAGTTTPKDEAKVVE